MLCTQVCKCKNDTCSKYSRNQGRGLRRSSGEVNPSRIADTLKDLCNCHNVPHPGQQKRGKKLIRTQKNFHRMEDCFKY
jgi:hypothetical protein